MKNDRLELLTALIDFVAYTARRFRLFYLVLAFTICALVLEYLATSLMIPMAPGQNENSNSVIAVWHSIAEKLNMPPIFRTWLWIFFLLMVIRLILGYVLSVLTTVLGKSVHKILSKNIFGHILLNEPMANVYTRSVGHYITLAGDDTFKSGTIIASLLQTLVGCLTAMVGMLVLFQFSSTLFFGVTAFLILSSLFAIWLIRKVVQLNTRAALLSHDAGTTFLESLNSLRSIRSLHSERFVMETYAEQISSYVRILTEMDAIKTGIKAFPAIALLLLAVAVSRPGVDIGMTDAALFAATIIIIRIFSSLGQMAVAGSQLLTDSRAVRDIGALVQLAHENSQAENLPSLELVSTFDLNHVSFGYAGREKVLDDISFKFEAGYTYAVVGPSGAGKSTLADILLGLSTPAQGTVRVNGSSPLNAARSNILLVEQQPKIFSSTVRENLLLGTEASDEHLYEMLQIVNLEEVVRSLEMGLSTRLTYLGENFSGGQRQRLGIARALLRKPDVLILDEATSALDSVTRTDIIEKIRRYMKSGIVIFITHDEEIAALADKTLEIGRPKGLDGVI